jgi:hypothetical protein
MFKPQFDLPEQLEGQDNAMFASLVDLFEDLSKAVERISENYHDDYVFKRYLQDKWNEILENSKSEEDSSPAAATV